MLSRRQFVRRILGLGVVAATAPSELPDFTFEKPVVEFADVTWTAVSPQKWNALLLEYYRTPVAKSMNSQVILLNDIAADGGDITVRLS